MKRSKRKLLRVAVGIMMAALLACVTINIYFPAEKVESVAGDIVEDIRKQETPEQDLQSGGNERFFSVIKIALYPSLAWAADVTDISNPTIRALKEKMKDRFRKLKPYYEKRALKEGDNGYLTVSDAGGLNLKEKRDLNNLVDAENADRRALYAEVAKALNIDPGQVNRVAEIFAKEWQKPVH